MRVPMLDPARQDAALRGELVAAFERVLDGGRFILGPEVEAFEAACAQRLGVPHAIGVSSGSDALLVALTALGVGPGDEVICPAFTFFSPAGAAQRLGARPVFVDIAAGCFTADATSIERAITRRTKAIVPVHLFGQCADMRAIAGVGRGVPIVEDAAQAFGATFEGEPAGSIGAIGCFSFFPTKNVGGLGDAGLVATRDDALAARMRRLRSHGASPKYHHVEIGGNFRIDALHAALLGVKLRSLDAQLARRRDNAARYDRGLAGVGEGGLVLPRVVREGHTWNQYVVRVKGGRRDALRAFLAEAGVETHVYYPRPLHLQPCFAGLGHRAGDLPEAEAAVAEVLALPVFPGLGGDEIDHVAGRIAAFFG